MSRRTTGFTLIEVMVALAIVAIALTAGVQATITLTNHAQRQSDGLLARICAENELVRIRLSRQSPPMGESSFECAQAERVFSGRLRVAPTPNPNFRRVEAVVFDGAYSVARLATVVGTQP